MWKKINLGFPWTVFWPAVFSDIFKIQLQSDSISADAWHMKYHGTLSHTSGLESVTNTTAKLQHLSTAISTHLLSACLTNTVMVERSCFRASNMWNFPFQIQFCFLQHSPRQLSPRLAVLQRCQRSSLQRSPQHVFYIISKTCQELPLRKHPL